MKYLKVLFLFLVFLSINACCSKKNNVETFSSQDKEEVKAEAEITEASIEKKMFENGYKKALVVYNDGKEAPCEYLIQVGDDLLIEPMHDLRSEYKIEKLPIWVKYQLQRRMSRCDKAQPVQIIAIEKQ